MVAAAPAILAARPAAMVVIVGGDEVSYGKAAPDDKSWRAAMHAEVPLAGPEFAGRVHFCGRLPYARYLSLLQVSAAHVYLTVPFVLSWSCLEAMASGCPVVALGRGGVTETVEPGVGGVFFTEPSVDAVAAAVETCLQRPWDPTVMQAAAERFGPAAFRDAVRAWLG